MSFGFGGLTRLKHVSTVISSQVVRFRRTGLQHTYNQKTTLYARADFRFGPSQWETALLCNDVSHWLGANLESLLVYHTKCSRFSCALFCRCYIITLCYVLFWSWFMWRHGLIDVTVINPVQHRMALGDQHTQRRKQKIMSTWKCLLLSISQSPLTHTYICVCVSELGEHWFRSWLGSCSVTRYYLYYWG